MLNTDNQTLVTIIADNTKTSRIGTIIDKLNNYTINKYDSISEFLKNYEPAKTCILLTDALKIKGSPVKHLKTFLKEELDLPMIYLADNSDDEVFALENITEPHEFILNFSDPREVELALKLTEEKYTSDKVIKYGELQFKMLLENSSDIFTIIDESGLIKYESPSVKKMLGYQPADLIGKNFFDMIYPDDREHCRNLFFENVARIKSSFIIKFRYMGKNGITKSVEGIFNNLLSVEGIESIIITGKDVTDKRSIEKKFLTNLRRNNTLIENLPIGVYRSTPVGELLMANSYTVKMFGYNSYRELEKIDLNSMYVQQSIREIFKELIDKFGEAKGFEFEVRKKNGDIIFVRDSSRAVYDDKGNIAYYEGVLEDITDKKRFESEIIRAKEDAEKADKLKSYFMAHLSHEIRTPVNSILTFISLLKEEFEDKLTDDLQDCFSIIGNSADRLIRTIDLIMNISSLQTGNFDAKYEWLDIEEDIFQDVLRDYSLKARYKGVKLTFINRIEKLRIYADRYSISQMFCNIIDNAIKYTPKNGEIEIVLYEKDDRLFVEIADTGIGISHEYLKNLFTPFTQEEMGYTRKFEGNGLGLAIAKKYAELNNAVINVKSTKGEGSNFTVIFKEPIKIITENFS